MVVVVLIAIATAASLSYLRPPQANADQEARRLAALFERLALEARLSGQRMAWRCEGSALYFEIWRSPQVAAEGAWQAWPSLEKTRLASEISFAEMRVNGRIADCAQSLVFPAFGSAPEFSLEIVGPHEGEGALPQRRWVVGDVAGQVSVQEVLPQ